MKRSMTSRMLLGAALLIAGVGVAAAQGMQAGGNQRGEARANAGAQRSGGQAQVQHRQGGGAAIQANRGAQRATAHTATRSSARVERPRAASTSRHATTRSVRSERSHVARTKSSQKAAVQARTDRASAKTQRSARSDKVTVRSQRSAQKADAKARTASQTRERSTTGQASRNANTETRAQARAGRANITAEQRTKLRSVVTARNVPHLRRVNFALRRGIFVPRHYRFARVAAFPVLFELYPDYRPYSFFVVEDEVVFVDSGRRIVDVVPLEGGAMASSGGGGTMAMETDLSPEEIREVQTVLVAEGLPLEVTGVWDVRTRDALIVFQRRHGFAANGFIDTRTVTALKLSGKISQNHIRGANRATTGRGNARDSMDTNAKAGAQRGESPNAQSSRQDRSTSGQGNEQPKAAQGRNEPKADKAGNEPKAEPRAEQKPAQPSTTGQGAREEKMNRPEPNRANQNR